MSKQYFPFYNLGLRGNPFRTLIDQEWAAVAVLPEQVHSITSQGFVHLQVTGKKGRGKTTTLLALADHFAAGGYAIAYEHIPTGQNQFHTAIDQVDMFFLDEAQRLSRLQRRRLLSAPNQNLQLILSSHEDLEPLFNNKKFPLTTVSLDNITVEHFSNVLKKRLAYFSLNPSPPMRFTNPSVNYLWQRFGSDLRSVERFLYEFFQQLDVKGEIRVSQLTEMEVFLRSANQLIIDEGP